MSDKTYKLIEIVGTSNESLSEAIDNGIKRAASTLRNLSWFEVTEIRGRIDQGGVEQYQVTMKVGMRRGD